eukprot:gnl/Dysnectes_brevis/3609_a4594_1084.p1 GENE.gnl/Dysnectes_brevis/3609_a4594_1084~~gnl/Dysnectes_brevis/3609_a4594_1084.p1  ORF type:complete len:251 (+),score=45.67 gnl/Dysnectes_brevis/3609_a4594_1084:127-879(+)
MVSTVTRIFEALGTLGGFLIMVSLVMKMRSVSKAGKIDNMAYMTYPFMLANAVTWTLMATFSTWPVMLVGPCFLNVFGIYAAVYCCSVWLGCAEPSNKDRSSFTALLIVLLSVVTAPVFVLLSLQKPELAGTYAGFVGNLTVLFFFSSPCYNIFKVVKEKDSSYLSLSMSLAGLLSAFSFMMYGLLMSPVMVLIVSANAPGVLINLVQVVMCIRYPSKKEEEEEEEKKCEDAPVLQVVDPAEQPTDDHIA